VFVLIIKDFTVFCKASNSFFSAAVIGLSSSFTTIALYVPVLFGIPVNLGVFTALVTLLPLLRISKWQCEPKE
jgi:hypothetical protein